MVDAENSSVPKAKALGSLANVDTVRRIMTESTKTSNTTTLERLEMHHPDSKHDAEMLAEFERRKRARTLTIPTDDVQVKLKLRSLNQPICLFGEDILDRRERLRALLSTMTEDEIAAVLRTEERTVLKDDEESVTWYHKGPESLKTARVLIADFSLRRAKKRLEAAREEAKKPAHEKALARQEAHKWVQQINLHASQVADVRPIASCQFSPDSNNVVTAGWSGQVSVFKRDGCERVIKYSGHVGQAGCARFHPGAYVSNDSATLNVASSGHDGSILLWSLDKETPLAELEKLPNRVNRVCFHPNGRHLAATCFDHSWRMFDLATKEELLFQEGHARAVSDVSFHPDGSLALTAGHDCYGRVWDLRMGRCIMFLDGHTKEIHTTSFLPNGYEMLTGGADNTIKVWDLRQKKPMYTIPAHTSVVSGMCVDHSGQWLVSSSFDCTLKMWSTMGWQPLRELKGHDTRILSVDISPNGEWIVSSAFDRTFKLWAKSDY